MDTWLVVLILGQMAAFVALIAIIAHYRQRSLDRRSAERLRILDQVEGADGMSRLLESPSGRRLVHGNGSVAHRPLVILLGTGGAGLVVTLIGGAFAFLAQAQDKDFIVPAAILLAAGVGLLLATMISFRLTRKLGLLDSTSQAPTDDA